MAFCFFMQKNLFISITDWQNKTFPKATMLSCVKHLKKEVQELRESIENQNPDRIELADCTMLLAATAVRMGLTYEDWQNAIAEKFSIARQRMWKEPNSEGFQEHVKDI